MTPRLNGSSRRPARTAETPNCCCRSSVASTPAELVVAVLTNDTSVPVRRLADRHAGRGTSGSPARRCCTAKPAPRPIPAASRIQPETRRAGSSTNDAPTISAMTAPISTIAPTTSSLVERRSAEDGGTRSAIATKSSNPAGMLIQNTARQPAISVSKPPTR
jgi:hypothetical protein